MARTWSDLQAGLSKIPGVKKVYFQPPEDKRMVYPCIRFKLSGMDFKRANGGIYKKTNKYTLTVIDTDLDSEIPDLLVKAYPRCSFDRAYVAENLGHTVFTLYY